MPGLGAVPALLKRKLKRKARVLRMIPGQPSKGGVKPKEDDTRALAIRG